MVINTWNAIVAIRPDREALDALATSYEQMGRWNDLIGVLIKAERDARWLARH